MSNAVSSYLRLRSALAINGKKPERIYIMLRGFCDGSGKSHEDMCITLTALMASESVWEGFDQEWALVLQKFNLDEFHMSEAMAMQGPYTPWYQDYEKPIERRNELVWELLHVLGRIRWHKRGNLLASSCSVVMADYQRARREMPNLKDAEAICVNWCIGGGFPADSDPDATDPPSIVLVFDSKERFQKTITEVWLKQKRDPQAGWPLQIKDILSKDQIKKQYLEKIEVGSLKAMPLQAADLLAWLMNYDSKGDTPRKNGHSGTRDAVVSQWIHASFLLQWHRRKIYRYEDILKRYKN